MQEVAGTAKLVDPAAVGAGSALTATLPRTDIEAALHDEAGADLFLEIARIQNGERNDRRIKVAWERQDLEKLLQGSSGETVSLTFDPDELQRMLDDPDFEAHGLKEKAAVITVALATGAGFAGGASAMTASDGGTTPAPAAVAGMVTDNSSAAVPGAVTGFVTDASSAGVAAPADNGVNFVTDTTSGGQPGAVTAFTTDASTAQRQRATRPSRAAAESPCPATPSEALHWQEASRCSSRVRQSSAVRGAAASSRPDLGLPATRRLRRVAGGTSSGRRAC